MNCLERLASFCRSRRDFWGGVGGDCGKGACEKDGEAAAVLFTSYAGKSEMSALWQRDDRDPASEGGGVGTPEDSTTDDIFFPISDEMLLLSIYCALLTLKREGRKRREYSRDHQIDSGGEKPYVERESLCIIETAVDEFLLSHPNPRDPFLNPAI